MINGIRSLNRPDSKGWLRTVFSIMLALCILWGAVGTAFAAIPQPAPEFYVLDQARVLKAEARSYIIDISSRLAEKTGAQVAVVTLNSLEDQPLEDVSLGILREWGLGDKEQNNGVLILVVPAERKSRIEVGYGLEGALPDGKTGRIQDEHMIPAFREGDYDRGVLQGYQAVISEIEQEYGIVVGEPASTRHQTGTREDAGESLPPWAVALMVIGAFILLWLDQRFLGGFITGMLFSMLLRGRGGGGSSGGGFRGGGGSGGGGGSSRGW